MVPKIIGKVAIIEGGVESNVNSSNYRWDDVLKFKKLLDFE